MQVMTFGGQPYEERSEWYIAFQDNDIFDNSKPYDVYFSDTKGNIEKLEHPTSSMIKVLSNLKLPLTGSFINPKRLYWCQSELEEIRITIINQRIVYWCQKVSEEMKKLSSE